MMNRHLSACALAAGLLATGGSASALTWELVDVSLDDFTGVTGRFDYDAGANTYSNWSLSVDAASFLPAYTYQPSADGGFAGSPSATQVDFVAFTAVPASGRYLRLAFQESLTDAGGHVQLAQDNVGFECDNCSQSRYIVGGAVTPVPEPATWGLLGLGLGLVAAAARRRRSPAVAAT